MYPACTVPICTDTYVFLININVSPFHCRQQCVWMKERTKNMRIFGLWTIILLILGEFSLHRSILWKSRSTHKGLDSNDFFLFCSKFKYENRTKCTMLSYVCLRTSEEMDGTLPKFAYFENTWGLQLHPGAGWGWDFLDHDLL